MRKLGVERIGIQFSKVSSDGVWRKMMQISWAERKTINNWRTKKE